MPSSVLVGIASVALALALAVCSLPRSDPGRRRALANLQRGMPAAGKATAGPRPDEGPDTSFLGTWGRRLLPAGSVQRVERLYAHAGSPSGWSVSRLLGVKLALPLLAALLGLVYASANPGTLSVVLTVAVVVVAFFLPELLLHSRGQERSEKITLELADLLDQVTICVEAGLGFDAAVARAGRHRQTPLGDELRRTHQDLQLGQSRRQAYESLARRTGAAELEKFVNAVLQADAYGVPIADVLRAQATEARLKRRQQAEERAMQIPTKVVFPLMLLILPVMFIVLLGPAVIDMLRTFR
jgi:tight adherence protein C